MHITGKIKYHTFFKVKDKKGKNKRRTVGKILFIFEFNQTLNKEKCHFFYWGFLLLKLLVFKERANATLAYCMFRLN